MKYNLNLTSDYCSHWTIKHALRELIANTIDEEGTITVNEYSDLVLITPRLLPLEAFLMGYSNKQSKNPIGQYGEGLKIAFLILTRENKEFALNSGKYCYLFKFEQPEGFSVPTLHLIVEENNDPDIVQHGTSTEIVVYNVTRVQIDQIYTSHPVGTIMPNMRGLYCQGLLVEPYYYIKNTKTGMNYGINLNTSVGTNRDRTYLSDKTAIIPILEEQLPPEFFVNFSTSDSEANIYRVFSDEYAQQIAKAYLNEREGWSYELMENRRIIFVDDRSSLDDTFLRYKNVIVARCYWMYGSCLYRNDDYDKLEELRIKESSDDENEEDEKLNKISISEKRAQAIIADIESANNQSDVISIMLTYMPIKEAHRKAITEILIERELLK